MRIVTSGVITTLRTAPVLATTVSVSTFSVRPSTVRALRSTPSSRPSIGPAGDRTSTRAPRRAS